MGWVDIQDNEDGLSVRNKINNGFTNVNKFTKNYSNKNLLRERLLEGFKATADWTPVRANLSQDTTNFLSGTSALAIEMTTAGNYSQITKTVSWNVSNDINFELKLKVADKTLLNNITIYMYSANGFYYKLWSCNSNGQNGWNTIRLSKDQFTKSGTILWSDTITSLQITFTGVGANITTIVLDSLKCNIKESANFAFVFDAGFTSAYTHAKTKLDQYGFKGCIAPNTLTINTANFMTTAQLQDVYNQNWDVLNHGDQYRNPATSSYLQLTKDVQDMQKWLVDNGITKGVDDIYIYPYTYTSLYSTVLKDLGFKLARDSVGTINFRDFVDPLRLQGLGITPSSTLSNVSPYIDQLATCGGLIVFYCHDIVESPTGTNCAISVFDAVVDYIASKSSEINVVTLTEYYDNIFN